MSNDKSNMLKVSDTRKTLKELVLDKLRGAILSLYFKPGQRLIERELCELMGVSRTAIREALSFLEAEGLVTSVPNKGPIVVEVTLEHAKGIYEVRAGLEGLACQLFCLRASDEQIKQLVAAEIALGKAFKDGEIHGILEATSLFYAVLFDGCGNEVIRRIVNPLLAQVNYLRATSMSQKERHADSIQEIRNIVDAIQRRDEKAAFNESVKHVYQASLTALATLEERTGTKNSKIKDEAILSLESIHTDFLT
ncbi:GntR family transcriptional regulator [Dasania marina]|uniref:GntR family transcriptional regulator n=1 Tax=Dasania marina TaxID=471499 RepID=UPI0030D8D90E|tara:strand:- start:32839 stop:33594 length:756 start_codon:yes stop_codon:yes gene_type:complete